MIVTAMGGCDLGDAVMRAEGSGAGAAPSRRRLAPSERMPQILDAALEEFGERGYGGASMAATAARAGVAKGLIYHYFPSKAELFKAVVRSCIQPAFAELDEMVAGWPGPRAELLQRIIEFGHTRVGEEPRQQMLFKLLLAEAGRFPELAEFYRAEVLARGLGLVGEVVRAGVASGEFRPEAAEEPGLAAVLLAPAAMGAVWRLMIGDRAPDRQEMCRAHVALALNGMRRLPG
jgi:AcrR family transcriptional regulator